MTLALSALMTHSRNAGAGVNRWSNKGPDGGTINALVASPQGVLYAGTGGGVFVSKNRGELWSQRATGLTDPRVEALAIDPVSPQNVFAVTPTRLFISRDWGDTWDATPVGGMNTATIDPTNHLTAYTAGDVAVYKTTDGGISWAIIPGNGLISGVRSIAVPPGEPSVIYLGTVYTGAWKTTDGGASWAHLNLGTYSNAIPTIQLDPHNSKRAFAITEAGILLRSTDAGSTWSARGGPGTFYSLVADPAIPGLVWGGIATGVVRSSDGGDTWSDVSDVAADLAVKALAVDPTSPGSLYTSPLGEGVYRWLPETMSWQAASRGLSARGIASVALDSFEKNRLFVADDGYPSQIFKTTDNGQSWTPRTVLAGNGRLRGLAVSPTIPSEAYAIASGVLKTTDGGETWRPTGLPYCVCWAMAVDPSLPRTVYVASAGGVLKSTDGGDSWVAVNTGLGEGGASVGRLVVDPVDSNVVYAFDNSLLTTGVVKSTDGGQSWKATAFQRISFADMAIDPAKSMTFYVATEGGLLKTTDGGSGWFHLWVAPGGANVRSVAIDPTNPSTIYVGTNFYGTPAGSGVFKSTDGGMSWRAMSAGLTQSPVSHLRVDPNNPNRLYAGTWGSGVWAIDQVPPAIVAVSPSSGPLAGGTEVTISGTNFMEGATVTIGGVGATNVVVLDTTTIKATVPLHAPGPVDVVVSNPTYQAGRSPRRFTYVPPCYVASAPTLSAPSFATAGQTGLAASIPTSPGSTYTWSISNGTITSGQGTGQITFTALNPGIVVLQVVENTPQACGSAPGTAIVSVASPSGTPNSVSRLVPIVLDAPGRNGSRFSSEITIANRGTTPATATLIYIPAAFLGGFGAGTVTEILAAGEQRLIPDILEYLRDRGLGIPSSSDGQAQGGTLRVIFTGLSAPDAAYALARTTTASGSGDGRAGLSYAGVAVDGPTQGAAVYGLRETDADRSNLAFLNAGMVGTITLRATVYSGDAGDGRSFVLPDITLPPGQWTQVNSALALAGFSNGYARIERTAGSGPFLAYGVVNDNVTNDGSYLPAVPMSRQAERQHLPVLVETDAFESELVLTNPTNKPATVALSYVESLSPSAGPGGLATEVLQPGEQRIIPHALDYLRSRGLAVGPRGGAYAGTLTIDVSAEGIPADGFVGVRTSAHGPQGGAYGVFYAGIPESQTAQTEAWIFGFQRGPSTRSNVAFTNTGTSPLTLRYEVYDGNTGKQAGDEGPITLGPGAWTQVNGILEPYGLTNGYARVVKVSGDERFVAYGVVNDGATPGTGTGDGSYVEMTVVR